ncbi:hypothetical protein O7632_02605 [Solwaraspora sp. WMMD406]|uniref:hypothetical protein n=1 Tax=Solwaraspora sp. WMMD406 TaxID=3016095 RepID=UPI002416ADEF|nr:hypothetical protein [Solwaraspora sp. WMMD406]MDG4763008.1 hypothetical protein [Solwaraspora sp. WMMD406]
MTNMPENLLSIIGIDGAGKSTQVSAVSAALCDLGVDARPIVAKAFGARTVTVLAEQLTGDRFAYHPLIPAELREWALACDLAQYTRIEFTPLLQQGTTLVWDRGPLAYRVSADVYGGLSEWVERAQALFPWPRRTYLLDLPASIAVDRLRKRSSRPQQADESEPLLEQVRAGLLRESQTRGDVVVLDATRDDVELTRTIVADWLSSSCRGIGTSA